MLFRSASKFTTPGVNWGFFCSTPGVAVGRNLLRKHAMELLLTGDVIGPQRALELGLVNRVVDQPQLLDEAIKLAQAILKNGPLAVEAALECVVRGMQLPLDQGLRFESGRFGMVAATEDMHEGLQAFLDKRKPDFKRR